jgi:peptidoglycan/xylan/chitin deacetylase (PgdA/CDA1 family)
MRYLRRAGYAALSADQFVAFLQGQTEVPRRSVLITFDDGYLDNHVYAYPVLRRYGLRATVFVVTAWVSDGPPRACAGERAAASLPDTPSHRVCMAAIRSGRADEVMLRWSEIRQGETDGVVEAHSHTHSHVRWDEQYADRVKRIDALEADLEQSRSVLRRELGKESRHLCWPWGRYDPDYQTAARRVGFAAQYVAAKGVNTAGCDPSRISRVVVKDRPGFWFASRLWIYRHGLVGRLYCRLRRLRV